MLPLFIALAGCNVDPAPEEVDGLAHWFWRHFDDEDEDVFAEGLANLHAALDADAIEKEADGSIGALSQEDLALVGRGEEDASALSGVYMSNLVACPLWRVEELTWSPDQDEIHPGTYVAYDREFTSDLEAYRARETDWLTWRSTYEVEGFGANYSASIDGWMRYVDDLSGDADPAGPLVLSRGVLVEPAFFDDDGDRGIYQDYQLQVFYERAPDEVIHMYVIWREMIYLGSADFSDESVQRFTLDGLAGWDEDADEICASE